jgi:excisionase family DNA binding protein
MKDTHNIEQRLSNIEALLIAQKKVLNFDEVAVYTGLSKSHLYKMTSTGGIPCYKPKGKHIYFERAEIDQWLLRGRKKTNEEIDGEASTIVTISSRRKKR